MHNCMGWAIPLETQVENSTCWRCTMTGPCSSTNYNLCSSIFSVHIDFYNSHPQIIRDATNIQDFWFDFSKQTPLQLQITVPISQASQQLWKLCNKMVLWGARYWKRAFLREKIPAQGHLRLRFWSRIFVGATPSFWYMFEFLMVAASFKRKINSPNRISIHFLCVFL